MQSLNQKYFYTAICHGLQLKNEGGKIRIHISKEDNMVVCLVSDDGIGREKARELKAASRNQKGESLGMKITGARIEIINKIKKTKASVHILASRKACRWK